METRYTQYQQQRSNLLAQMNAPVQKMEDGSQQTPDKIAFSYRALTETVLAQLDSNQSHRKEIDEKLTDIDRFSQGFAQSLSYLKSERYY